jgi:hypothetical protein
VRASHFEAMTAFRSMRPGFRSAFMGFAHRSDSLPLRTDIVRTLMPHHRRIPTGRLNTRDSINPFYRQRKNDILKPG